MNQIIDNNQAGTVRYANNTRCQGFTLIELLVVIAIIAILAAILFPVFAAAREKARQTTCASNEQQIGLAFMQYTQDYDEFLPCGTITSPSAYLGEGWMSQIYSYVKSKQVFACPDDTGRPGVPLAKTAAPTGVYPAYRYNMNLIRQVGNITTLSLKTIGSFNSVATTVLVYETDSDAVDPSAFEIKSPVGNGEGTTTSSTGSPAGTAMYPGDAWAASLPMTTRHQGGSEWLCADGHVKWLRPEQVSFGFPASCTHLSSCTNPSDTPEHSYTSGSDSCYADGQAFLGSVGDSTDGCPVGSDTKHVLTFSTL